MYRSKCPRCGEVQSIGTALCATCGIGISGTGSAELMPVSAVRLGVEALTSLIRREGLLPLAALIGVLPFFPVAPAIGIGAGTAVLLRARAAPVPPRAVRFAVAGVIGGVFWLGMGLLLFFRFTEAFQSIPLLIPDVWPLDATSPGQKI
jgi:hypothetical protein